MRNYFFYSSIILFGFFLTGCSNKLKLDISVKNHSGSDIDSMLIYAPGFSQTFTRPLLLGRDTSFVIDFSNAAKVDGELKFWFYLHDGRKIYYSNYCSNGLPPTDDYEIEILANPIKVKWGGFF